MLIGALIFVAFQLRSLSKAQRVHNTKLANENVQETGVKESQTAIAELRGQVSVRGVAELNA
jgi:hypothetical protein